jgi:hypothetical protein
MKEQGKAFQTHDKEYFDRVDIRIIPITEIPL